MKKYLAVYKVHLIAWGRLFGTLCGILLAFGIFGFLFGADTMRALRLALWLVMLGVFMSLITSIFWPEVFDKK